MIALATVLSLIKIVHLPYGGSVTVASMLPIAIIAYRHGVSWGLLAGFVHGVIQNLLGLSDITGLPTWKSVLVAVLLDYLVAFAVIGLAGAFRKAIKNQAFSLSLGCVLACVLRYICHVITGATIWAGLSIPSAAALSFSFIYNSIGERALSPPNGSDHTAFADKRSSSASLQQADVRCCAT